MHGSFKQCFHFCLREVVCAGPVRDWRWGARRRRTTNRLECLIEMVVLLSAIIRGVELGPLNGRRSHIGWIIAHEQPTQDDIPHFLVLHFWA
jgi:hypothetical protein